MRNILSILFFFCSITILCGQTSFNFEVHAPNLQGLIPQSPEAGNLGEYSSAPINLHTGNPQISFPLMIVGQNQYQLPLSINHFTGGNRIEDLSGNTGLNNSLNAGGVITRQIRDQPDDAYTFRKLNMCLDSDIGDQCRNCEGFCSPMEIQGGNEDCIECEGQYFKQIDMTGRFDSVGFLYNHSYIKDIALEENLPTDLNDKITENVKRINFLFGNYLNIETIDYNDIRADDIILDIDLKPTINHTTEECLALIEDIALSPSDDFFSKFVDFAFDVISGISGVLFTDYVYTPPLDANGMPIPTGKDPSVGIAVNRLQNFAASQEQQESEFIPFVTFQDLTQKLQQNPTYIPCFSFDVLRPELEYRDTESDLYNFNFNGYTGQFVFGHDGIPKIFSDQDLKIEYQMTQTAAFPSSDFSDIGLSSVFGGGIQQFTIITPNGTRYVFSEREISITNSEGQTYDNIIPNNFLNECAPPLKRPYRIDLSDVRAAVTSWYLKDIIMPTGLKEIGLNYEKTALVNHNNISYQHSTCGSNDFTVSSTVNTILGKRVKDIQWRTGNNFGTNGKVEFSYTQPRADLYYPTDLLVAMGSNYSQALGLTSVKWVNDSNQALRETVLTYDYHLEATPSPSGNCNISPENTAWVNAHKKRLRLRTVTTRGWDAQGNLTSKEPFKLDYNSTPLPSRHSPHQDFYGLYNGTKSNYTIPFIFSYPEYYERLPNLGYAPNLLNGQSIFSIYQSNLAGLGYSQNISNNNPADRNPDEQFAIGGMLSKITFPLGGFEEYDFELHRFRNINAINDIGNNILGIGGGLRVKTARLGDANGNINTQNYVYREQEGNTEAFGSTGKLTNVPIFAKCNSECFDDDFGTGAILYSRPQNNIGKVVYSKVIIDHNGNGRTENFFRVKEDSYYNDDMFNCPEQEYDCFNVLPTIQTNATPCNVPDYAPFPIEPNIDWHRGQLEKQVIYDETDNEIQSIENTYTIFNIDKTYGIDVSSNLTKFGSELAHAVYSGTYQIISGDLRITQSTETLYGVSRINTFEYGSSNHKNITASYFANSDNKIHRTEIDFAHEKGISCLLDDYMISVPVETRKYVDGVFQGGINTSFQDFNSGQCLAKKVTEILKNQATVDRIVVTDYTADARPTGITRMNFPETKYFWTNGLLDRKEQGIFITKYEYYPDTRLQKKIIDVDNQETTFTYDGIQRLITANSRNGNIQVSINYDNVFDVSRNSSSTENKITTITQYTDAPPQTTTQTFNGLGRPLKTIVNGVVKNENIYDNFGRIESQTYLTGNFTLFEFDNSPLNRIKKETYPDGTFSTINYGSDGTYYKITQADENTNTTSILSDILGRDYKIINSFGDETIYEYGDDRIGSPSKIIPPMGNNPNFTYHYTYDERKRLETKTIPQGGITTYTYYDATDLPHTMMDANGSVTTYIYDTYGREIEKKLGNSTISTNTYDTGGDINIGKMTQSKIWKLGSNNSFITDYSYDDFGRIEQSTAQNHIGGQDITDFTYNHADWQTSSLRKHTGYENLDIGMGYEYDGFGRITKTILSLNGKAQLLSQSAWNNRDELVRKILGNGLQKIDYQYNNRGWLTRINQPFNVNLPVPDCSGGGSTSLTEEELLTLLDADIYCGQAEENLNYIIQNRFVTPSFNVDCYNPCENTGDIHTNPDCTMAESNEQVISVTTARDEMRMTYTTNESRTCADGSIEIYDKPDATLMNLPNKLYRLRLCNGTQVYVFEDELALITGTYYIIQEETIQHINQTFTIKDKQGVASYVQLEELLTQVVTGKDIYVNNYQPNQNPCSPKEFDCSIQEITQNEEVFINIDDGNGTLSSADLTYPTYLYRVKICGLDETYLFPDELAQFPNNYAILQTIRIEDANQKFMVGSTFNYFDGDDLFFLELHYNEDKVDINATARKNGDIAFMDWQIKDQIPLSYGFEYDVLNRLKGATYSIGNYLQHGGYNVSGLNYDKNGNIQSIIRNTGASINEGCKKIIDDLVYGYNGNQLISVADNAPAANRAMGFKTGVGGTYTYDANGNLKYDPHKQATYSYNHLNLPSTIALTGQGNVNYTYDANGIKLSKSNGTETRDYINGIEYVDNQVEAIYHEEGRIIKNNGNFEWQWHLKDHLGNTRLLFADGDSDGSIDVNSELLSIQNYYPFGMLWSGSTSTPPENKYLYNGNELQSDFGLNTYDFNNRMYDPAIGRFWQIDPLADQANQVDKSPFAFAWNNPIALNDPSGLAPDNEFEVRTNKDGTVTTTQTGTEGGDEKDYITYVDADGNPTSTKTVDVDVEFTDGPGDPPSPGKRLKHGKDFTIVWALDRLFSGGNGSKVAKNVTGLAKKKKPIDNPIDKIMEFIDRKLLNKPKKRGDAPTFKKDGTPVEIHHVDQNPSGPFKEMHWKDHRGKGNHGKNHPNRTSRIDRKDFKRAQRSYWGQIWDKIWKE